MTVVSHVPVGGAIIPPHSPSPPTSVGTGRGQCRNIFIAAAFRCRIKRSPVAWSPMVRRWEASQAAMEPPRGREPEVTAPSLPIADLLNLIPCCPPAAFTTARPLHTYDGGKA
jgi:hypothetical protein